MEEVGTSCWNSGFRLSIDEKLDDATFGEWYIVYNTHERGEGAITAKGSASLMLDHMKRSKNA